MFLMSLSSSVLIFLLLRGDGGLCAPPPSKKKSTKQQGLDVQNVYVWIDVACLPDNVSASSHVEEMSRGQAVAEAVAAADALVAQTEAEVR